MRTLDWVVLGASLVLIAGYGLWRGRGSDTTDKYLLAGRSMPWYAMALSIMATQASAITFISTTGQAYVDGMRFVQFYFGLPLAMILISATAVPIFHRARVYTAYEFLEQRFDAKTRMLVSAVFLIQRGLAVGVALYAPSVVLTVILGVPDRITILVMGIVVVLYTVSGGIQAVTWTDFQQMFIMVLGIVCALLTAIWLLPADVGFGGALAIAGAAGRLNAVVYRFDWNDQYNIWSGVLGGMFLALAYFGTDQSQVQRYLTGKSITESRLSLLFNAAAKIPMQFCILLTGAMVFVFYTFTPPPVLFHAEMLERAKREPEFAAIESRFAEAHRHRKDSARTLLEARRSGDEAMAGRAAGEFRSAQAELDGTRLDAANLVRTRTGNKDASDVNYIFLSFVIRYLPVGLVGLMMAAVFAAAMSTISAEINSLATVSLIDIYRRHVRTSASDRHYVWAARAATAFWGGYAVVTAQYGRNLGSLIEAVNRLGSLFYGGLLGVFVLAFYFPRVSGNAAFVGVLAGEAAIFATHLFTSISFLWYNVIGCVVVVLTGVAYAAVRRAV